MITSPMDVLQQFPVRKTNKQKQEFRNAIEAYVKERNYQVCIQKGSANAHNVVIGDPKTARYLVTAHYDTPASIGIPNIITPCNIFWFIVYQLFVVALLLGISVGIALAVYTITGQRKLALLSWYIVYFGILALMMIGPANRHNANDNTSGIVTVLEILSTIPDNLKDRVCFVLFDLEERGLVGSASYRKTYKDDLHNQIVINLDCVGDGDIIQFAPVNKAKKDEAILEKISDVCGNVGKKELRLRCKGFTAGSSDHKNFPYGVGIMAFHHKKGIGLYCNRIHTWRDTVLEYTNVNILRAAIISLIGSADK